MKIAYINGYRPNSDIKSKKIIELENILNIKIDELNFITYKDIKLTEENIKNIQTKIKKYDIIIASSTGAYIARHSCYENNVPLISINPVFNLKETFSKLNLEIPFIKYSDVRLEELILLGSKDELIPVSESIKYFNKLGTHNIKIFDTDHRFQDISLAKKDIIEFVNRIWI